MTQFDIKRAAARRTSRRAELARTRDRPQASAMGRSAQREEAVAEASFARYMKPVRFGARIFPVRRVFRDEARSAFEHAKRGRT